MKNEKRTVFHRFPFFYEDEEGISINNSKKESIKHENGTQLFEFRLLY